MQKRSAAPGLIEQVCVAGDLVWNAGCYLRQDGPQIERGHIQKVGPEEGTPQKVESRFHDSSI